VNAIMTYSWQKPSENHERKLEDLKLRNVARHYSSQHGNSLQEVMVLTFPSLAFDSPDPKHNKESNTTQHTNAAISTMASSLEMNDIANEVISQALTAEGKSGEGEFVCPCLLGLSNASFQGVEKADVKMQLMGIPADLHLELFKQLSPITSACLSLTCKAFHSIHWSLHGKVGLEEEDEQSNSCHAFFAPFVLSGHAGIPKFMPVGAVKLQREEFPKEERLAIAEYQEHRIREEEERWQREALLQRDRRAMAEYWERVKAARRLGGHRDVNQKGLFLYKY
jgi:hypothetical protein